MAEYVRITDVGPRDGLQNEPGVIPTAEKVELIRLLCDTGVDEVEVTSFVSPKWVPQLGDAAEVLKQIARLAATGSLPTLPMLSALVPNRQGMESLVRADQDAMIDIDMEVLAPPLLGKVCIFASASETFSKKNINASIEESLKRFAELLKVERHSHYRVRAYISCAIACPFEGPIHPDAVCKLVTRLIDLGVDEVDLADTIGVADVTSTVNLLEPIREKFPGFFEPSGRLLTLHLHDTFGRAADCVKAALDLGVRSFDGAVAGLGGCPYASTPGKRAPGNIATQALVRTIHDAGYRTNVNLDKLEEAGRFAMKIVGDARRRAAAATPESTP